MSAMSELDAELRGLHGPTGVERWDVYDIADELADVPGMLSQLQFSEALDRIRDLERRLWAASKRGGTVGPWPEYAEV